LRTTALIRRDWMKPDGTPISEEEAGAWATTFFFHLRYEVDPIWKPVVPVVGVVAGHELVEVGT
jgi:hypothetical protein